MVRVILSLLLIGGICGTLLVSIDKSTAATIAANREARARTLMLDMLGASNETNLEFHSEVFGDCQNWVFQRVQASGYAGLIDVLVLWRAATGGLQMRVTAHRETPGIGDFIDHARNPWITTLDNQPPVHYANLDNVSGATITTAAIRRAAQLASQQVEDYCAR